jgi:hypothetical protein
MKDIMTLGNKKIMVLGHKRSGKDTFAKILNTKFGLKFDSSSYFCANLFIFEALKDKYGYKTAEECFRDRGNHREEWFDLISNYNKEDLTKLASKIFETNDIYVGLRSREELDAARDRWGQDLITIWIDSSERVPLESEKSCTIGLDQQMDYIVCNNFDEKNLIESAELIYSLIVEDSLEEAYKQ